MPSVSRADTGPGLNYESLTRKLELAITRGNLAQVDALLEKGADPEGLPESPTPPLANAILRGERTVARKILAYHPNLDRRVNEQDDTYLLLAIQYLPDDVELISKLLEAKASANDANRFGETPLLAVARSRGQADRGESAAKIVILLKEHDANVLAADVNGETALMRAAARQDDFRVGELLLDRAGTAVGARAADGRSALDFAAQVGATRAIERLVAALGTPDGQDARGHTALHWAASADQPQSIRALVALHASIDIPDLQGLTALHDAAFLGAGASVQALLEARANPLALTLNSETPRNLAETQSHLREGASYKTVIQELRDAETMWETEILRRPSAP